MLLSDLAGKEIINLADGAKLGFIGDADLAISANGGIEAIILTSRGGIGSFWSGATDRDNLVIPWQAVKKIGAEVIIIDLNNKTERVNKYSI